MMNWEPETKTLIISYQDLEHIIAAGRTEEGYIDFDAGLDSELFMDGLQDMDRNGLKVEDIETLIVRMKARTIWARGTDPKMLKIHKGTIQGQI
jgi:hypothetical protein